MMCEAVGERTGEPFRSEHARPFIERQIAGRQRRAAFVALAEDIEQKLRANCCERHVTEFADDQQFDVVEVFLQSAKAAFISRLHEFVDQSRRRREGDTVPLLASRQPQGERDMSLACSKWSECDAVLALLEPFEAGQFENHFFVDRGLRREIEGVEAFNLREPRNANATLDVAPFAIDALQFAQTQEIARSVGPVLRRFHRHFLILAREGWKLQRLPRGCLAGLPGQRWSDWLAYVARSCGRSRACRLGAGFCGEPEIGARVCRADRGRQQIGIEG
jgi:hypothetical protein